MNTTELIARPKYAEKFSRLWERYDEACHGNAQQMRDILEITLDALETAERHIFKTDRDYLALVEALENYKGAYENEAQSKQDQMLTLNNELCKLLPGCQYMDPPDGGSVTPLEQVRRMVADYRERIAELEARTVALPKPQMVKYVSGEFVQCWLAYTVDSAIRAAGINLTVEG